MKGPIQHALRIQPGPTRRAVAIAGAIVIATLGGSACSRSSHGAGSAEAGTSGDSPAGSHPGARAGFPAATSSRPLVRAATAPIDHTPVRFRDGGTREALITPIPIVPTAPAATDAGPPPPLVTRQPDWDLSPADPARDYARRYAFFTRRYPDGLDCVAFGASEPANDRRRVTVKTADACTTGGGPGTIRDVFLVDLAGDHLTVDDKTKRNPLALWPDGSDPEGPPAPEVRQITDMRDWKSPLQDTLIKQGLAPLRMQAYGRGTYPLVSIARWHGAVQLGAPPDALQPLADAACASNDNMPMGIVAGFDRSNLLRITCPSATRWEKF